MTMPGRKYSSGEYRYGYQNQEVDNEIKGEGNSINYKYRMHDPRIGRFFALDPLRADYPHNSPYAFSENVVINAVELEGLERKYVYNAVNKGGEWVITKSHNARDNALAVNLNVIRYFDAHGKVFKTVYKPVYDKKNSPKSIYSKVTLFKNPKIDENEYIHHHFPLASGIPPATPTEFDDQFIDQGDNSDPSFEDRGNLVDDSEAHSSYPNFWDDLWGSRPKLPIDQNDHNPPTVESHTKVDNIDGTPFPWEKVEFTTIKYQDYYIKIERFYDKGNKSSTPDSIVVDTNVPETTGGTPRVGN